MCTTLFTIAGMEQFVPVFLGEQPAPAPRAVTVQRCLRVAGAKSDIESVGRTGRHGTFLEMLGNFSFGDYYKREAIGWAWEFVTNVLKLDPSALYVTVHTADDEARADLEREIGLSSVAHLAIRRRQLLDDGRDRTVRAVHRDLLRHGRGVRGAVRTTTARISATGTSRFWNVVFQQYNRSADGTLEDLPRKAIDTGAGLERMLAVCQRPRLDV